ncbi:Cell division inhibitor MinD [Oligella ureolytica]|uniref:Iron-sulfur cluster carrier protein n=1 Tax=Oligella ureolytica TaxID=90244 RepID=A0A378XEB1_9BURK|nr:iron-sulfur cluster carrier protein ApbC [Oligella ureolytica]QPT41012.1 iron-sulfur cluster carrier protein ApbC [Oligella ureolytica]SUA53443.1 Cell division inhibitor MinD [Oligella ureolytica]
MNAELATLYSRLQKELVDPSLGINIGHKIKERDLSMKKGVMSLLKGSTLHIKFEPGYFLGTDKEKVIVHIRQIAEECGFHEIEIEWSDLIRSHIVQGSLKPLKSVKNIIAVSSGKGGVGKSTTSSNIALALAQTGARVGILDADVYGPSQPLILNIEDAKVESTSEGESGRMKAQEAYGLAVNSIGFMLEPDAPAILRGPMVAQAVEQLLMQTAWPDLDYLIIDMPPGTGDIALTLSQKAPMTGAIVVTTPQDVALLDARKGLRMFQKVNIPILGVVENMSVHVCTNCGHAEHIFGEEGGKKMSEELEVPWLGALPLSKKVREQTDAGQPTVISDPESEAAKRYALIARRLAFNISELPVDRSGAFPKVVVENI